ncbi:FecR family protein [Terrimonas pollutisoli]|uniref:FecR family protein n=1 Tax=Terrimonas pollutisoli TaxID=3034147 RepID=UPI0023ECC87E|nr:FecR family protein [Terrimonas sp. H1YJ31]
MQEKANTLLLDNRFVDWVINPQSPYAEYWLQWVSVSPENAAIAESARSFLLEFRANEKETSKEINKEIIESMLMNIRQAIGHDSSVVAIKRPGYRRWYWAAAASLIFFLGFLYLKPNNNIQFSLVSDVPKENLPPSEVTHFNGSEKNELVFLPDGSKVTLAKGSRITYSRLMNGKKRKVSLSGVAFFDVKKNPEKPFYIYTTSMVIKVLGTSFRVNTLAGKESVTVKTGKVSVCLRGKDQEKSSEKILLPQQICTYSAPKHELITTSYTGKSKIEIEAENISGYNFEDAPLANVLKTLEKMYNLPVHYDKEVFKNCFITISLEHESLEDKLQVITKTVGASFSISEYGISIEGRGCK